MNTNMNLSELVAGGKRWHVQENLYKPVYWIHAMRNENISFDEICENCKHRAGEHLCRDGACPTPANDVEKANELVDFFSLSSSL